MLTLLPSDSFTCIVLNASIATRLQQSQVCKSMRQSIDSMWADFVIEKTMQTVFKTVKPADVKTFVINFNSFKKIEDDYKVLFMRRDSG